ncbi:MAG: PIN domain-containing protein, partial [Acidobacteriota bacterium]|nr:PIN domain-containing protein [Acidobacteriota bacterium]
PDAGLLYDACDRGQITIYIPTMCLVEIVYLQEKGRITADLKTKLDAELSSGATGLRLADLTDKVVEAMALIARLEIPEMPDRVIAATAMHLNLSLISRDRKIRSSRVTTVW